jgi:tetratricopeptide (TPR) repeat protein
MKSAALTIYWICFSFISLWAHGDVHVRIVALTKEIKMHPDSAELYLLRGELFHVDEQYKEATSDFKRAKRKGLDSFRLHLAFAKNYQKTRQYKKALAHLERILSIEPQQVMALRLKGNVLLDKKDYCGARIPLKQVIAIVDERLVENYLDLASACQQCAAVGARQEAVAVIEKGIADLGPLLAFYEALKAMAIQQQDYKTAIAQQNNIIHYSIRKERPYFERALLYMYIEDKKSALEDLQMSQDLITQLPTRFQQMEAMLQLQQQIAEALQQLNKQ